MPTGFWQQNGPWVDQNTQRFAKALSFGGDEYENSWCLPELDIRAIAALDAATGYTTGPRGVSRGCRIYWVLDTSGSMYGNHMEDGCAVLAVLNGLARRRIVHLDFVVTGYSGGSNKYRNCWHNKGVPVPDWCFESIDAWHGTEGLSHAMTKTRDVLLKSDLAFAYTDACICDEALKPSLWRNKGLTVTGLYSGNEKQERLMSKYFDDVIARRTKDELAEAMLHLIRSKTKRG